MKSHYRPIFAALVCGLLIGAPASAADVQVTALTEAAVQHSSLGPQTLHSAYLVMRERLESSPIDDSFDLQANVFNELTTGDVYALMPYSYDFLTKTLTHPHQVCQAIMLHVNVKGCVADNPDSPLSTVNMYIGRKEYQHPEDAIKVRYEFAVKQRNAGYTLISMTAPKGPLQTENIAIHFEFLPINSGTSFIHFTYSANYGNLARMALNAYLATLGRNKVGFTETGVAKNGDPVYIKGIRGVVERNTMRYFFALHSYFSTYHNPEAQRFEASLNRWFDYVEKYPRQLLELSRDEYLKAKRKESRDVSELKAES